MKKLAITGTKGTVTIGAPGTNPIAELSGWSLDLGVDNVDVTNFDSDGWREFLAGIKEWSGSFEGNLVLEDSADPLKPRTGQAVILQAWIDGDLVEVKLQVAPGIELSGKIILQPSMDVPAGDKASISCNFQGSGALTLPSTA